MLSNIGNFLQIFAIICSVAAIGVAVLHTVILYTPTQNVIARSAKGATWQSRNRPGRSIITTMLEALKTVLQRAPTCLARNDTASILCYCGCFATILSFLLLVYCFIISDFSVQNVFFNSSTLKPLIFKIAAAWASHEGSILLWLCLLQIVGCCYVFLMPIRMTPTKQYSIIILSIIQILFGSFIYFTSNPFLTLSFKPQEGLGLNPMLQDMALSIHPPILYLGYVSYVVPFIVACSMLITSTRHPELRTEGSPLRHRILRKSLSVAKDDIGEQDDNELMIGLKFIKLFASCGILFLSVGIALGSWWAYRELGWGGFWFFDPVENISLLPWLSGIILHHTTIVTLKSDRLAYLTIILSIITFLLAVFSTFLVRSGLLESIHSFSSSPERAIYMLGIFAFLALGSLVLLVVHPIRMKKQVSHPEAKTKDLLKHFELLWRSFANSQDDSTAIKKYSFKEIGIILGNTFFLLSLLLLLLATLYPILYSLFYQETVTISKKFFINNFTTLILPTLFLASIFTTNSSWQRNVITFIVSLSITALIPTIYKISLGFISGFALVSALFLMIQNLYFIIKESGYLKKKLQNSYIAMVLGHFGFGLLVFSITLNAILEKEFEFIGKVGDKKKVEELNITLRDVRFAQGKNYYRQIAEFWIEDRQNNITILSPENRLYTIEKTLSQESSIYSYLPYDLYAVLSKIDGEIVYAQIYYKPMMSFLWIAVIIIAGGFLIGLVGRNNKTSL